MVMRFRVLLPSFLFLACMAQTAAEGETKGTLDGEVFIVEKGELGKPSDGKFTLVFQGGKLRSRYFEKEYGHHVHSRHPERVQRDDPLGG
jgi:hypothetical protein